MVRQTYDNLLCAVLEGGLGVESRFDEKHHFCVIITIVGIAVEALNRTTLHRIWNTGDDVNRCE